MPWLAGWSVWSRRRRWLIGVACVAGPLLGLYTWAFVQTYNPAVERIAPWVWNSHDPAALGAALSLSRHMPATGPAGLDSLLSARARSAQLPAVPPALFSASDQWVQALNESNPDAILFHQVDAAGNLYVVLGAWWMELTPDQQVQALDQIGNAWRRYLKSAFGSWDTSGSFTPGIVVVDTEGEVAEDRNGSVKIFRSPAY